MIHFLTKQIKVYVTKRKVFTKFLKPNQLTFINKNSSKPLVDKKLFRRLTNWIWK